MHSQALALAVLGFVVCSSIGVPIKDVVIDTEAEDCVAVCSRLTLFNCTLIDGNGGTPLVATTITIWEGIIESVEQPRDKSAEIVRLPAKEVCNCPDIDCAGRFVMPGLVDSHVHVSSEDQNFTAVAADLHDALVGGVTLARDMGGDSLFLQPLVAAAAQRSAARPPAPGVSGPRERMKGINAPSIRYSTLVGGAAFFEDPRMAYVNHGFIHGEIPWLRRIGDDMDADAAARQSKAIGETAWKLYGDLDARGVSRAAAAAHKAGLKVWGHAAVFPAKPSDNIAAGMDVLSHAAYLVWEPVVPMPDSYTVRKNGPFASTPYDSANITRLLQSFKDNDRVLDATVWVFSGEAAAKQSSEKHGAHPAAFDFACNVTGYAHRMGVKISTGTDDMIPDASTLLVGQKRKPNVLREIESLVDMAKGWRAQQQTKAIASEFPLTALFAAEAMATDNNLRRYPQPFFSLGMVAVAVAVAVRSLSMAAMTAIENS